MAAAKNDSIGTCPCPFKGCELVTSVFKFRGRSDNPARHRYAGRLYCVCSKHGRIESQEWILENARIDTAAATSDSPVAASPLERSAADLGVPLGPKTGAVVTDRKPPAAAKERARERWGFFD